jgi:hypothetical protein
MKNENIQFLCQDCENYNRCNYYYGRFKSSYICKYFHLPKERKTVNSEQLKQAIELLKNVRRELIDYNGVNNAIAEALYIVIEIAENKGNEMGGADNE